MLRFRRVVNGSSSAVWMIAELWLSWMVTEVDSQTSNDYEIINSSINHGFHGTEGAGQAYKACRGRPGTVVIPRYQIISAKQICR